MSIEVTWATLLYVASSIGVIWAAIKCIGEARRAVSKPIEENESRLNHIESCLDNDKKRMDNLEQQQAVMASDIKQLLSATVVMLSHMGDGNHTGEIKRKHAELEEYIIDGKR